MTDTNLNLHVDTLDGMGRRFAAAWKAAEAGREVERDHEASARGLAYYPVADDRKID